MRFLKRMFEEERGVTAIVVAVCLFAIFAAAMLSLDAGNLWSNRRNIVTGTDAAALAAAQDFIKSGSTTCPSYLGVLQANSANTSSPTCQVVQNGALGTGYVVVTARKSSSVNFGKVVGVGNQNIYSMSAAQIGFASAVSGLRSMGMCQNNKHIQQWLALVHYNETGTGTFPTAGNPVTVVDGKPATPANWATLAGSGAQYPSTPTYPSGHVINRLFFTKDNPNDCGSNAPGNWGWIDFDNSNGIWVDPGYSQPVGVGDCYADGTNQPCGATPGSHGASHNSELDTLVTSGQTFYIPIFSNVTGNGNNVKYTISGFIGVRLWGYQTTGAESGRYFDFEFQNAVLQGVCCDSTGVDTGARGVKLCDIDHDTATLDSRCKL